MRNLLADSSTLDLQKNSSICPAIIQPKSCFLQNSRCIDQFASQSVLFGSQQTAIDEITLTRQMLN